MSPLTQDLIAEKIAQCSEALADLQKYREIATIDYVRSDPDTYYAICYRFISAIESLFDIGQYMLAAQGMRADSQREVPTLLARNNLMDTPLSERFTHMYGFRNRLVHAYGTLDDAKVVEYLQEHLDDIRHVLSTAKKILLSK
jgi:uncharacterized protein YutE (UPF0331/DUF86 family)